MRDNGRVSRVSNMHCCDDTLVRLSGAIGVAQEK